MDSAISNERRNRRESDRLHIMLNAVPIGCWLFTLGKKTIECNQYAVEMLGYSSKEELISTALEDCLTKFQKTGEPSMAFVENAFKETMEKGMYKGTITAKTKTGSEIFCQFTLVSVEYNDSSAIMASVRESDEDLELSRRMHVEIAEESSRAKSRFLARMSHEIRTPITAVLGISEIQLQAAQHSPEVEEAFMKIHSSAGWLLGIVNDILDLSKIEAGKMEVLNEQYETTSMISDVLNISGGINRKEQLKFDIILDENMPQTLTGDIIRIEQIINNLLSNAFKYTEEGRIELKIEWVEPPESELLITIADTGYGMTKEQLNALTNNEYMRFHESEYRGTSGTGLGIPIVHHLVQIMNAKIKFISAPGRGTTVQVRIPQQPANKQTLGKETARRLQEHRAPLKVKYEKITPEPMPYGKVLLVDDVDANLYVTKGLLAFYDIQPDTCVSGLEAIEKIKEGNKYDIIFMDHMMPYMNGTEAMHKIREMGYTGIIIVLTANAIIDQSMQFIRDGFDGYISKPIQTKFLHNILLRHIRDKYPPDIVAAAKEAQALRKSTADINNFHNDAELQKKLKRDFIKNYRNAYAEICDAIDNNETAKARLFAHTLKGSAGLINENILMKKAEQIELVLQHGKLPPPAMLKELDEELTYVIENIQKNLPIENEPESAFPDKEKAAAIFDKLTPLLEGRNMDAIDYVEELRSLPETAILVAQIEDFDFVTAGKSLSIYRKIYNI